MFVVMSMTFIDVKAQVSEGGVPYSLTKISETGAALEINLKEIPEIIMPPTDIQKLRKENDGLDITARGILLHNPVNLTDSSYWVKLENGDRLWRLKISSKGAIGLEPIFEGFYLPPGAKLFVYDCEGKRIRGAFTHSTTYNSKNFTSGRSDGNCFIIEYYEPKHVRSKGTFTIYQVVSYIY